jgi:hypothetical protein
MTKERVVSWKSLGSPQESGIYDIEGEKYHLHPEIWQHLANSSQPSGVVFIWNAALEQWEACRFIS